jgi:flavin reductase (DIM6/NTAB) family NADH-FMN oxidoreductase RutF
MQGTPSTSAVARSDFITAMRRVASSVTVVTTDGTAGRHGATVSAFSSVSADPPTVLVCLHAKSRIAAAVEGNGRFCVNVLPDHSDSIADRFAGAHDREIADRFTGIPCQGAKGMPPQIEGATSFACTVDNVVQSGSHLVVFGRVEAVGQGGREPLTYLDGAYHRVTPKTVQTMGAVN